MRAVHIGPDWRVDQCCDATTGYRDVIQQTSYVRIFEMLVDDIGPVHDESAV